MQMKKEQIGAPVPFQKFSFFALTLSQLLEFGMILVDAEDIPHREREGRQKTPLTSAHFEEFFRLTHFAVTNGSAIKRELFPQTKSFAH